MSDKQKNVFIHFSKGQHNAGLLAYKQDGLSFQALIVPKMWRWLGEKRGSLLTYEIKEQKDIRLLLFEGDCVRFDCGQEWADFFDEMERLVFETQKKNNSPKSDEEDQELHSTLFERVAGFPKKEYSEQEYRVLDFDQYFSSFFNLVLFSQKLGLDKRSSTLNNQDFGFMIGEGQLNNPMLNVFLASLFIQEIQSNIKKIRLGYVRTREKISVIKGRISGRSLAELMMTESLVAECIYDKFISDIPLFRILVTTLEKVIRGACFPSMVSSLPIVKELKQRAHLLRVELSHITSYPLSIAMLKARRLKLRRLDARWTEALHTANLLLSDLPKGMKDSDDGTGGLVWKVDTAKMWEDILKQIFEEKKFKVTEQGKGWDHRRAWEPLGEPLQPDLIVTDTKPDPVHHYLLDAKYKTKDGNVPKLPDGGDRNQLFVYSLLYDISEVGILYPAKCGEEVERSCEYQRGYEGGKCSLRLYSVPFPQFSDLESISTWKNYCKGNGDELSGKLTK